MQLEGPPVVNRRDAGTTQRHLYSDIIRMSQSAGQNVLQFRDTILKLGFAGLTYFVKAHVKIDFSNCLP